jgi:hypothetical protein
MRITTGGRGLRLSMGPAGWLTIGPLLAAGYLMIMVPWVTAYLVAWTAIVTIRACKRERVFRHRGRGQGVWRLL